jgi:hypothetical protein
VFQALDRLYDRTTRAVDVQALTFATSLAVKSDDVAVHLRKAANALRDATKPELSFEEENTKALAATDELRHHLAPFM